jgi:23S rRNA pseudouridine1911/1915/1917 synthase
MKKQKANITVTATENGGILEVLKRALPEKSGTTIKAFLTHRQVCINNKLALRHDDKVKCGDLLEIQMGRTEDLSIDSRLMKIIYADNDIIVIDKQHGLLSVATNRFEQKTAFRLLSDLVKRQDPANKIFVVHRLDRETSGLMLFARNEQAKQRLQEDWTNMVTDRRYVAVTEGIIPTDNGYIDAPLAENSAMQVYVARNDEGRPARTDFQVLQRGPRHTLVELHLETGRKNQIRVHLKYIGYPIVGDKKYGAKDFSMGRLALHASRLCFIHPRSGEEMNFEIEIPQRFRKLVENGSC